MKPAEFDAVLRCSNAGQLQRRMDKAALGMVLLKSGPEWLVTYRGHTLYSGDFDRIKRHLAWTIFDTENQLKIETGS